MNSYELSRRFWDWAFDNPDKVRPIHAAIYFFAIEHCNRLGWKEKFGLPSQMVMEAIGVKNWRTYSAGLFELVEYNFIIMVEQSRNQYSANIIAIVNFTKAHTEADTKALDKALQKHSQKQSKSIVSIDKQETIEQLNKEQVLGRRFSPPTLTEVIDYCFERGNSVDAEKFYDFYESKGWMVGKNKMKDWKAAVRTWEKGKEKSSEKKENQELTAWEKHKQIVKMVNNG